MISKYTRQDLIDITCCETLSSELFDELTWQHPESLEEFRDNEWGDKECRSYFLRRLVDMALVSKEDMDKIMKNMEAEIV